MSGTLSTSASSLGSQLVEESMLDSSRNPVRAVRHQRRADENRDQNQGAGKALTSDAAAAKATNLRKVRNVFSEFTSANTLVALSSQSISSGIYFLLSVG